VIGGSKGEALHTKSIDIDGHSTFRRCSISYAWLSN